MGYRSDIKAVFYTKDVEQWPALRLFVDENFPESLKGCLQVIGSSDYSGYVFSNDDVKWYDNYPEVIEFNIFVDAYTDLIEGVVGDGGNELPWSYEFIRVGENTEDIETKQSGNPDYVISVARSIRCDF